MISSLKDIYAPFLKSCWVMQLSDTLISTIIPVDNSTISKYRAQEGFAPSNKAVTKEDIEVLFAILEDYPWIVTNINPVRTKSNRKFWTRRSELLVHFENACNELKAKLNIEEDIKMPKVVVHEPDTEIRENVYDNSNTNNANDNNAEVCDCKCNHVNHVENFESIIKEKLKEIVSLATLAEKYDVVSTIIDILKSF